MKILVDTREQRPLPIKVGGAVEAVVPTTLSVGDYMVEFKDGSRPPLAFERKGLSDLWGTMTADYPRFKKEMVRAKESSIDLILLIEAPLSAILEGNPRSQFQGESMLQKLFTLTVRYRMPVVYCAGRMEAARYVIEYFEAVGREYVLGKKASQPATRRARNGSSKPVAARSSSTLPPLAV